MTTSQEKEARERLMSAGLQPRAASRSTLTPSLPARHHSRTSSAPSKAMRISSSSPKSYHDSRQRPSPPRAWTATASRTPTTEGQERWKPSSTRNKRKPTLPTARPWTSSCTSTKTSRCTFQTSPPMRRTDRDRSRSRRLQGARAVLAHLDILHLERHRQTTHLNNENYATPTSRRQPAIPASTPLR